MKAFVYTTSVPDLVDPDINLIFAESREQADELYCESAGLDGSDDPDFDPAVVEYDPAVVEYDPAKEGNYVLHC